MKVMKKISFIFIALCMCIVTLSSVYCANIDVRKLKAGDVIYFDNSATHWNSVKIYIFNKNDGDDKLKEWNDSDTMSNIDGTDIWKFEVTADMLEGKTLGWVIFHNGNGSGENQTIDLCYIDNIYAYKADSTGDNNNKAGYWYVYDKSELEELINKCEEYEKEYYTEATWNSFEQSLNAAKDVLKTEIKLENADNGESGWKCEYQSAIERLKQAKDALVVNKQLLQDKIDEASGKDTTGYTKDTVDALNSTIAEAKEQYKGELSVDQLKEQLQKLDNAINGLKTDKDKLKEKVQEGNDKLESDSKYYTDDSVKKLQDALDNGKNVLDNGSATVKDIQDAVKQIEDAINDLEFNDKLLDELIEKGNSTEFDKYTDETVKTLKDAINEAEGLKSRGNVTVEEFKDIEKKVNDGINNLVEKEKSVVNNTKNPNTGSYIFGVVLMLLVATAVFVYTIKYGKKVKNNN